jgi:thiosulfate dehydrogenase
MDYQRPNHVETPEDQARVQHSEWQYLKIFVVIVVAIVLVAAISFGVQVNKSMGALADERPPSAPAQAAQKPAAAAAAATTSQAPAAKPATAPATASAAKTPAAASPTAFAPPAADAIPEGPMGDVIRRGEQIFLHTSTQAKAFVGNTLNCVNCHLDAGRAAHSAPLWGAYTQYPAYRSKTKSVDTFSERLRGCFLYSMNGKAPPHGDEVLVALEAYAYWMAKGAPVGEKLPGASYPKVPKPAQVPDYARGQKVFTAQCALCHGDDGQGQRSGDVQVFPPLWGKQSYNWGAGMHEVDKATGFIKANMPLGKGNTLSDQDAWDVATYINSHERPQDPRFTGNIADTRKRFHDSEFSLYGQTVNGQQLGRGAQ